MPALVSSQFSPQFLRQLQNFRNEHFLCDCRLVVNVGDSRENSPEIGGGGDNIQNGGGSDSCATLEFPAHRLVLAASSPFFREVFQVKRNETVTTVNLKNCTPECLEVILHFLYSGELQLGRCHPQQVLNVVKAFKIKSLEQILSPLTSNSDGNKNGSTETNSEPNSPLGNNGNKRKHKENGVANHENEDRKTGSPGILKRFCNKHSIIACNYCVPLSTRSDTDSDASVAYQPASHPTSQVDNGKVSEMATLPPQLTVETNLKSTPTMNGHSTSPHHVPFSTGIQPSPLSTLSSPTSFFPEPTNIRPGYYGPLLPTRPVPPFFIPGMQGTPNGIFPTQFPKSLPMLSNQAVSPLMKSELGSPSMVGKSISSQGVTASFPSPTNGFGSEAGMDGNDNGMMVPSTDKEGWCRNKKYIQKVPNGFKCTVCNKVYGRYNSVSYHVTIYHRNPPIKCDEAGCQFTTREARYIHFHKYYRHGTPLPKSIDLGSRSCPFCRHVAKSPAMLEKHVNRHMPDCIRVGKTFKCQECEKELSSQRAMVEHMLTHNEEKTHQCDQCSYKGRTESNLRQHKLFKHSSDLFKKKFTCDACGYCCPTEGNLDAHKRRIHKMDIPLKKDKIGVGDVFLMDGEEGSDLDFEDEMESPPEEEEDEALGDGENGLLRIVENPPPYPGNGEIEPINLSQTSRAKDSPNAPPPSYASSMESSENGERNEVVSCESNGEVKDSVADTSSGTDLDDSHSNLVSATTGYHSMVNYGTV